MSDPWVEFRSADANAANLIRNDPPAITTPRAAIPSSGRVWGDAEAAAAGLYESAPDSWAAFRVGAPLPQAATAASFEDRFSELDLSDNQNSESAPSLRAGLAAKATAMTRGAATSPMQAMAVDFANQRTAAGQGTTPVVGAHQQNLISRETFTNDAGDILYRDPSTGQVVPTDGNKHVVLRDPADNTLKVYARTETTDEGPLSAAGRLINTGIASTTAAPMVAARTAPAIAKADRAAAVNTLSQEGVTAITAGQKRGSRTLKYAESTLGDAFGAGGKATQANERAAEQFTAAVLRRAGIAGESRATPEVLEAAAERIGGTFDKVAARNPNIRLDDKFTALAERAAADFKNLTGQESPLLASLMKRIRGAAPAVELPPAGARLSKEQYQALSQSMQKGGQPTISGETYQSLSSEITRYMRQSTNPELKMALGDLKAALDAGVQRGLRDPKDAALWKEARRQWNNLLVIEKAATGAGEQAALGYISPQKLRQAVTAHGPKAYVRGKSDFAGLARAGNAVLSPLPDSGTAQRAAVQLIPGLIAGGAAGTATGDWRATIAGLAPGISGRVLMSTPVQRLLSPSTQAVGAPDALTSLLLRSGAVAPRFSSQDSN